MEDLTHHAPEEIKGWGIDADPENDPTYPMRQRKEGLPSGYAWPRPQQQHTHVEVLHSNERPNLSAVYGTPVPPRGLSGMLRRWAFRYSESSYGHWLPLVLADRVAVVEGLGEDLLRGRVPNLCREFGWGAEWKHNRPRFLARLLLRVLVIWGVIAWVRRRDDASAYDRHD